MASEDSPLWMLLDEGQQMLASTAAQFLSKSAPVGRLRELPRAPGADGFSRALWAEMAELGWLGLQIPEAHGGLGLGFFDLAIVLEASGQTLMPEPFVSTLLLGAQALLLGGTDAQRARYLPGVADGSRLLALAYDERGMRGDLSRLRASATREADGFTLRGVKPHALDAHVADAIVVAARVEPGDAIGLFIVPRDAAGLAIEREQRMDLLNAATVRLDAVRVGEDAVVGPLETSEALLSAVLDRARIGLSAQMLGAMERAFEMTVAYLKERVQFGVPIGSFQALQHRAARLFIEIALARSSVLAAARAVDDRPAEVPRLAALAKAKCGEAFWQVAAEAIQMHGGIGMTAEHDIGFYFKRAQAAEVMFGDGATQRRRWAEACGY
ncbi:MAG: acyl-CoA dehydrogenase family protein [Myxococcales bacterium]|nr:acyl-CoA dehydrogenase family protein [Myxococcales bacterium]